MNKIILIIKNILLQKDSLSWQVCKYMLFGGIAVLVDQLVYYGFGLNIIPIFKDSDPIVEYLGISITSVLEENQSRNLWFVKTICWFFANATAYLLNRLFVFSVGKHKTYIEIILFFTFSLPQFIFVGFIDILIKSGWEVTYANYSMLCLAAIINFLVRKFIIFKG